MLAKAWEDGSSERVIIGGRRLSLFVDKYCVMCPVCAEVAPDNFSLSADKDHYVCHQQPRDADELARCEEAVVRCPTHSIGDRER